MTSDQLFAKYDAHFAKCVTCEHEARRCAEGDRLWWAWLKAEEAA